MTAMTATVSPSGAAAELRTALREAGLPVGATGTDDYVQLGTLRASDAGSWHGSSVPGPSAPSRPHAHCGRSARRTGSISPSCVYGRAASRSGPAGSTTPYGSRGCWVRPRPGRRYPTPRPYGTCWRRPSPPPREVGPSMFPYAEMRRLSWSWALLTLGRLGG